MRAEGLHMPIEVIARHVIVHEVVVIGFAAAGDTVRL
jgi:hypothetical protein